VASFLASLPFGGLSASALVGVVVLLVLTGRLVTRKQLEDVQRECDTWRGSAETWQQVATQHGMTLEKHGEILGKLITYAETADHALASIQAIGQHGGNT
jgi:hypothetical protein